MPSVPMMVEPAKRNGIVTAHESPKTANRTASAMGSAIASPRARSEPKMGSSSDWIAAAPVT